MTPSDAVLEKNSPPSPAKPGEGGEFQSTASRRNRGVSHAAAWTVAGYAARQVLRFAFNLALTRLVAPQVLGVMTIINLLIQSLHMFSDLGISQCVTHHQRGDEPRFLNTAWTLQVCRGLVLWLLSVALAVPAAWFYEEPALAWLIPIAGLTAFFDGLQSTAVFTLNRRLSRGRLVLLDLIPYTAVMTVAVLVIAAIAHRHSGGQNEPEVQHAQVFALVCAVVAGAGIQVAASHRLLRGRRHRLAFDAVDARALLHFGGWIFLCTGCGFLASQADRLVIGKLSKETLGVYNVATQLTAVPTLFVAALCAQLVFPLYSRLFREGNDTGNGISGVHRLLGLVAGWLVTGLIVAGPAFIDCLYRGKYQGADRYIQLLAGAAWFTMLQCTGEAVLLARGQARLMALGQVLKLAALVPLMTYGYRWNGLIGLVVGYGVAELIRYMVIAVAVRSLGQRLAVTDLGLTLLVAASSACILWIAPMWGGASAWVRLAIEAAAVTALWAAAFWFLYCRGAVFSPRSMTGNT
jgi:O-antigen/teichoic acid export membrane protein